jgi:hypothetical protein
MKSETEPPTFSNKTETKSPTPTAISAVQRSSAATPSRSAHRSGRGRRTRPRRRRILRFRETCPRRWRRTRGIGSRRPGC